jgi:hypothetical protein
MQAGRQSEGTRVRMRFVVGHWLLLLSVCLSGQSRWAVSLRGSTYLARRQDWNETIRETTPGNGAFHFVVFQG